MEARKIYDLLEQKRVAFEGFLSATTSLRGISDFQNNREMIVSLIDERRRCINTINRIDGRIDRMRRDNTLLVSGLTDEAREKIGSLTAMVREIAEKAGSINRECEEMLTLWRNDIRGRMTAVRRSHPKVRITADRAYRTGQPRFLDITL